MRKINFVVLGTLALLTAVIFASCEKGTYKGKATLEVRLTDAPALYDAVMIDIQGVQMLSDHDGWFNLPMKYPGLYNLLDFSNGRDTLLGEVSMFEGNLTELRLILGNNNSVVVNGISYPLTSLSTSSGINIKIQQKLEPGSFNRYWLDFDAALSIIPSENGTYQLKPVIHLFTEASSGAISGNVFPAQALPVVRVYNATDTLMAIPASDGHFLIRGIPAGNYTVVYKAGSGVFGHLDVVLQDVAVVNGETTPLAAVTLILP